ncbi:MAG: hypothetical protein IBJ11_04935 [Phycisphaerales bacterium]|nr:hypothetical protein [Phycisphaerales bacterium]
MVCARSSAGLFGVLLAVTAAGCVKSSGGSPAAPRPGMTGIAVSGAGDQAPRAPLTNVAAPAPASETVVSRLLLSVQPIGRVPFDGQLLPLVSPDGRRLATSVGEAPSWATILAAPQAGPERGRIEIYDLTRSPPVLVPGSSDIPVGVVLGRSADDAGFLVESPRPDGARWIGRVPWTGGAVEWLVQGTGVNAGATLAPAGGRSPVFCTRGVDATACGLAAGPSSDSAAAPAPPGESGYSFPAFSGDGSVLYAFLTGPRGTELLALGADTGDPGAGFPRTLARRVLAANREPIFAYQAVSGVQSPAVGAGAAPGLLFHNPAAKRMQIFSPVTGRLTDLAEGSIAGAWAPDDSGLAVLVTAPGGLVQHRLSTDETGLRALPPSRVLDQPWVPRATTDPARPFVLIGPGPRDQPRVLELVGLRLVTEPAK